MGACDGLADAVGEERPVGQARQCIVVRHMHDALVGEAPLRDFRFQSRVGACELLGPRLDAPLQRALYLPQGLLAEFAIPVLSADQPVGVLHDDEQDPVKHTHDQQHDKHHLPLCALDASDERRDVIVDLEHRRHGAIGSQAHRDMGR